MAGKFLRLPEIWFTAALLMLTAAIGWSIGVPLGLPSGDRAAFVGIHYLYPLAGVGIWALFAFFGLRRSLASTFLIALPCYAIVLICHFNLKLWRPLINPATWDALYWQTDQFMRPIITACMSMREALFPIIPADSNFYMVAFIAMFYFSFCYHAWRSTESFRSLFLAALIFQGLGALAYLVMPALGPFLFEKGVEPLQTVAQAGMLGSYREIVNGGPEWVAANGGSHFTVGLAAMPSLHTGGSFLFLLYAARYAKPLVPTYLPLFGFIAIDAVANRWHYVIDLPVGMLLAWGSAWAAERLCRGVPVEEFAAATPTLTNTLPAD
jgi:PAP2 superfamily